jgi:hypothetical protein
VAAVNSLYGENHSIASVPYVANIKEYGPGDRAYARRAIRDKSRRMPSRDARLLADHIPIPGDVPFCSPS